jgi:hypothetical protein
MGGWGTWQTPIPARSSAAFRAQAARLALAGMSRSDAVSGPEDAAEGGRLAGFRAQLIAALTVFEDRRAQSVIDMVLAEFTPDTVLEDVMAAAPAPRVASLRRPDTTRPDRSVQRATKGRTPP